MLCSRCSENLKPIVALDIDGTLGDYHAHFLRFATPYFGHYTEKLLQMSIDRFTGDRPFSQYVMEQFGVTLQDYRDCKLAYRQGGLKRSMPINEGAVSTTVMIRQKAELWLTTTRPYLSLDGVIKDTTFWLELHGIDYDGLLFDDDKYVVLAERIDTRRVVAVVDDVDEMYDAARDIFGPAVPLLYLNGYNDAMKEGRQYAPDLHYVRNWVDTAIDEWAVEYV